MRPVMLTKAAVLPLIKNVTRIMASGSHCAGIVRM